MQIKIINLITWLNIGDSEKYSLKSQSTEKVLSHGRQKTQRNRRCESKSKWTLLNCQLNSLQILQHDVHQCINAKTKAAQSLQQRLTTATSFKRTKFHLKRRIHNSEDVVSEISQPLNALTA